MAVKSYKAKSIQEAIKRLKKDLGPDAIILSTKRLPGNVRDPYCSNMFEVTAAPSNSLTDIELNIGNRIEKNQESEGLSTKNYIARDDCRLNSGNDWDSIKSELLSIKDMLFLINQTGNLPESFYMHPESLNLYARLVKAGISKWRIQTFIEKISSVSDIQGLDSGEICKRLINEILSSLSVLNPFKYEGQKKQLAAFIGPTGVGKTTTIAKLAAGLSLKEKKKVGIISIDSYRIGALEQLKTYAAIMGLPCLPAFSKKDLEIAVRQMQNKDVILIDTAGQSHLDKERMKELSRLMEGNLSISSHLVLSVTTKREDMKEAAENFVMLNPKTYVFTKMDETRKIGNIIDQSIDLKMPISFLTNGQRVPEDIMPADKKNLLRRILNFSMS